MRTRLGRMAFGIAFGVTIMGGLSFGAREAFAYRSNQQCQSLCSQPDGDNLCNQCCINLGTFDGGLCTLSGTCVCYEN